MSHFDAIFDKICCLPACQQTLFCLQQCEVCQFFCYRFACGRHTRIDSFELILKIVWSVELFPLAQLHFLLMVFFLDALASLDLKLSVSQTSFQIFKIIF